MVLVEEPRFATLDTIYDQPTTVHHWQLKDLVVCENQRVFYTIHGRQTVRYDTQKQKATTIQSLEFSPYCLTMGQGYIAAGGPSGYLDVRQLSNNDIVCEQSIGRTVNNSLHICDTPIGSMLFVSNNDRCIRIFSLPSMDTVMNLSFSDPVNCAATTHDAEFLVSVGDSIVTYIHQRKEEGYWQLGCVRGFSDVGMSCAWDPQGVRFAGASQDGSVSIWDRRSFKRIARIKTGCSCRCVKFSPSPMDLVAFSEDRGVCHLVDTRNMSTRQTLKIDIPENPEITGICFSPEGKNIFVGTSVYGILNFSVDTVGRRRFSEGSFI